MNASMNCMVTKIVSLILRLEWLKETRRASPGAARPYDRRGPLDVTINVVT